MSHEKGHTQDGEAISYLARKSGNPEVEKLLAQYSIVAVRASDIKPSPENDELYGAFDFNDDPTLSMLRKSIVESGLGEPVLITLDGFILSGHRRFRVLSGLGWKWIPVRFINVRRSDTKNYHRLLAKYNPQRVKSVASIMAERFLLEKMKDATGVEPWSEYQERRSKVDARPMVVQGVKSIEPIGERRAEFLEAVKLVIEILKPYWPVTVRTVHYRLLNDPPLTQLTKDRSERWRYRNDLSSYNKTSDLIALARYHGEIPWAAIADMTRETREFHGFANLTDFVEDQTRRFLNEYGRNRQEGQPHHVEVLLEKNTLVNLAQDICQNFHAPFTPLRGYGGPSVWHEIAQRWHRKVAKCPGAKCILIIFSDHDPEGLDLADDAVRSLRGKHCIPVRAIRAGVTMKQIREHGLSPNPGKESSSRFKDYVKRTGTSDTWECESLPPEVLRQALHDAISSALNIDQLKAVQESEAAEQIRLAKMRQRLGPALLKTLLEGEA